MSFTLGAFDRMNIQHIREFILYGVECGEIDHNPYEERLKRADKKLLDFLHKEFPTMEEEHVLEKIYNNISVYENVYMEIGLQAGATLTAQFTLAPH